MNPIPFQVLAVPEFHLTKMQQKDKKLYYKKIWKEKIGKNAELQNDNENSYLQI